MKMPQMKAILIIYFVEEIAISWNQEPRNLIPVKHGKISMSAKFSDINVYKVTWMLYQFVYFIYSVSSQAISGKNFCSSNIF